MLKNFSPRLYQQTILGTAARSNTLVVLPTGMGKSAVAFMLATQRLHHYPKSKILMLAPTKPLCEQHVQTFKDHLNIDENKIVLFTGSVKPEKRAELWKDAQIIISTPQGLENDVINRRVRLEEVSLLIFDECVVKGTLITLANGEKVKIEHLEEKVNQNTIYVNSINEVTGNIEPRKITKFHKIKSHKEIIEISTESEKISVTEDHLLFSKVNGKIEWVKAHKLKKGDEVACPISYDKKINFVKKVLIGKRDIINQYSKNQQKLYFDYIKILKLRKETKFGSRNLSQLTGINEYTIRNWINKPFRKPIIFRTLEVLEKINLLPLYSNSHLLPLLSRIMGHLYGDGWAYKDKMENLNVGFSGQKVDLETIQKELELFGVKYSNIFSRETNSKVTSTLNKENIINGISSSFTITDRYITKILQALDIPIGNKTTNLFFVPKWIMEGSNYVKREFLSSLMGSESYAPTLKKNKKTCNPVRISFNVIKELDHDSQIYANQLQELFLNFGIKTSISRKVGNKRKDGFETVKIILTLSNSNENMINFIYDINFTYAQEKRKKSNQILKYLLEKKVNLFQRKISYDLVTELHREGLGSDKISRKLNINKGTIENWIYLKREPTMITTKMNQFEPTFEGDNVSFRWKNIRQIIKKPSEKFVYDLTIEGNHNYIANNFVVHNCHHATGEYAYVWIAERYEKKSKYPRILGLTASPGSDLETVQEICTNLNIEKLEVRTEKDSDMKPYIQEVKLNWVPVKFPDEYKTVQRYLQECRKSKLLEAQRLGFCKDPDARKTDLLRIQGELIKLISTGAKDFDAMRSMSLLAEALKVEHAIEMLECQGVQQCYEYLESIVKQAVTSKTKAVKNLMLDANFKSALYHAQKLVENNVEHPKLTKLKEILTNITEDRKVIIFTQFRDSANLIVKNLDEMKIKSHVFVGQAKKKGVGFNQKKQKEVLDQFRNGEFQVLVATSVAEEGLDIPKVDEVLFFEPVPSAIRSIQRRGRTGRLEKGEVTILMTSGTRDEGYKWSSHHKEKRMYRNLEKLKDGFTLIQDQQKNQNLSQFVKDDQVVAIIADHREKDNRVVKELIDLGISVKTAQLTSADYVISGKVGIELKKIPDFVASIIDGRLLDQIKDLKQNFDNPILIIEGEEDLYSVRKVHANAIRGMLASIAIGFSVPILHTRNPKDTAGLLAVMAKREQDTARTYTLHSGKPVYEKEQQEFFISSIPNMGLVNARRMLEKFGSVKEVVNATMDDLVAIEGIGKKTAERLVDFFKKVYLKE